MSELEGAVLGVIWQRGPCSADTVAKQFAPVSSGWSSSAGSIYPLVAKLHRAGSIAAIEQPWGQACERLYRMTPKGLRELRTWVASVPEWAGSAPADPIRTRTFFLGALKGQQEVGRFVQQSRSHTIRALHEIEAEIAALPVESSYERVGLLGARLQLQAKLSWLAQVAELARPEQVPWITAPMPRFAPAGAVTTHPAKCERNQTRGT